MNLQNENTNDLLHAIEEKHNLRIRYFQPVCNVCKQSWAIYLNEGQDLSPSMCTCRKCALAEVADKKDF